MIYFERKFELKYAKNEDDYPSVKIGHRNPYYKCKYCGKTNVEISINGHCRNCEWSKMLKDLNLLLIQLPKEISENLIKYLNILNYYIMKNIYLRNQLKYSSLLLDSVVFYKILSIIIEIQKNRFDIYTSNGINLLTLVKTIKDYSINTSLKECKETVDFLRYFGFITENPYNYNLLIINNNIEKIKHDVMVKCFIDNIKYTIDPNYKPKKLIFD